MSPFASLSISAPSTPLVTSSAAISPSKFSSPSPPPLRRGSIHLCARFVPSSLSKRSFFGSFSKPLEAAPWEPPKYVYPDPIPQFAVAEAHKFGSELRKKLLKSKEVFGDDIDEVVKTCEQIFSDFLHKEYGGPGTLLVEPFTDMLLALKEKELPGGPVAARAALLWAQNHVDDDWDTWTSRRPQ
ncbi:protein PLASTID REDOX INSENSITIVE 2-like [Ananas comosus]|uniref:Protein PLASTID REDOX INSENSITIVE 2-like n=1 Tax=Ananas comosus TaxID=4615 RepID=A0A6P5GUY0_ANACO|nr:protein PLASTID REDOX INSENSITIVE 2-like [Ananas comosus]XP_020112445.1 protein PLASTID REDOX INSENSITIVE 2-like [Ananas comosus]XP_020112453.1 protein PLASTID REDOX INSENSITIVE 2-like [Ananas comosus]XP_020112456.1 protein PLASTID REDOX INSENSITIVE 2-like [Ananas comosus]XP_020112464.1 protein PLASTID REDOX INSENSITIVE 2-like [Ananas comosus]